MRAHRGSSGRRLSRSSAVAAGVASAALLLVGVLQVPAGAAGAPYVTTTAVVLPTASVFTGGPVTLTARVDTYAHGVAAGTMTFSVLGADSTPFTCDNGDALNNVVFTGGSAVCTISGGLSAADSPYSVSASYSDTAGTTLSPSTSVAKSLTVKPGKTTTTVSPSVNPSATGQAVTFTAAVATVAPAVGAPTGTVTFAGVTCDGGTNVIAVVGGLAPCAVSLGVLAPSGSLVVSGVYSGDSGFATSTGSVKQIVNPAGSTVTLVPSTGTCTGDLCTIGQGIGVSFTGTVATTGLDGGSGVPTGSLVFSIVKSGAKTSLTCDGGSNTVALVAGAATCNLSGGLAASVYFTVTAKLVAPGYSAPAATLYENSQLTGTSTTISPIKAGGAGSSFTVTAIVAPLSSSGSITPTGFVNVLVCGSNSNGYDGCQGGAAPVGAGGVAQFLVGGGEIPGSYTVSAVYTGDANFYTSTAHNRGVVVGRSPTNLTLLQSGGFATISGQAVSITATLVAPDGAAGSVLIGPMTGNITFTVTDPSGAPVACADGNSVPLAIGPGQVEGTATCYLPPGTLTTTSPTGSTYVIGASYSGDTNYNPSTATDDEAVVQAVY